MVEKWQMPPTPLAVEAVGDPTRVRTDCAFATSAGSDRVHPDVVWENKSLRNGTAGGALQAHLITVEHALLGFEGQER